MQTGHSGNQCIHCSVSSCRHHAGSKNYCALDSIHVCPQKNIGSGNSDESMCGSYHKK